MTSASKIYVSNPFGEKITIRKIRGNLFRGSGVIGHLDVGFNDFVLAPNAKLVESPVMELKVAFQWGMIWEFIRRWSLSVNLESQIDM